MYCQCQKRQVSCELGGFYYAELINYFNIKSNQFVGKKYRASDFLKKQRNKESKFLLETLQSKRKKKVNNKHSQVFLMYRENPEK